MKKTLFLILSGAIVIFSTLGEQKIVKDGQILIKTKIIKIPKNHIKKLEINVIGRKQCMD